MTKHTKRRLGLAVAFALAASPVLAAPSYVFDNTTSSDIPGLTGFSTTGAMMDGMSVTAEFVGGGSETVAWADTGANSGGVTGTGWSLNQTGDTFAGLWNFSFTNALQLQRLTLTGNTGLTLFDVEMYDTQGGAACNTYTPTGSDLECSAGSARGARMTFTDGNLSPDVTYSDIVGLAGANPVGDLFHVVSVDFGVNGIRTDFSFRQDTDNDSRFLNVPIPGTAVLLGLGLGVMGWTRRRAA